MILFRSFVVQPSLRQATVARLLSTTAPLREKYINRVQLLGRVGRDPEQRGEAHPIIMFPLATQHTLRNTQPSEDDAMTEDGAGKSITSWHTVVVTAPASFKKYVMDYITKGSRIMVDGSLTYYKYTMPDGSIRTSSNVKAREVIVMSTPRQDEESREPQYEDDFHSPPRS